MTKELPELPAPFGHIHDGNGNQPLSFDRGSIPWERSIGCSTQEVFSAEQMHEYARAALAALPVAPDDVDRLLREVFALCESTEEAPWAESFNEHQRGFDKGRRFEAKSIRKAIGAWFQDEFCGRSHMGEPVLSKEPTPEALLRAIRDAGLTLLKTQDGYSLIKFAHAFAQTAEAGNPVQAEAPSDVVAFEFYNPATGHAIVDYTVNTHVGRLGKEQGYEARPLGYANPPPAAVKTGDPVPLWQAREALDSLEEAARGDAPFSHYAANIIRTALEQVAAHSPANGVVERAEAHARMIADFPALSAFHERHALGPMAQPSCLCCGQLPESVAIKHAELPGILICVKCRDAALATQPLEQKPVALDHIACIEDGVLRYISGRKAPAWDCELYAMPDGGRAPALYTSPQPEQVAQDMEDAERWRMASTSRNHGIIRFTEFGMGWVYDQKAVEIVDATIRAARASGQEGGGK